MPERLVIQIDRRRVEVPAGSTVAAAILASGLNLTRRSVTGQPRGPVCGMGICYECRVTIDGLAHRLGCQTLCREGMEIFTDGAV